MRLMPFPHAGFIPMKRVPTGLFLAYLLLVLNLIAVPAAAQRGARVIARGLDQLAQESSTIIQGSIISVKVEPHPHYQNLMTVVVRMRVTEVLKGAPTQTLEFRQYIWDIRDELDGASYQKGQEVLLMLGPESEIGLRSPVGLEQGRFRILRTPSGPALAVNGRGNAGLFDQTEQRLHARGVSLPAATAKIVRQTVSGPISLTDLKTAIRSLSGVTR